MEDFALVEADFQQYYHLNIDEICPYIGESRKGFARFARLFSQLPKDSRSMLKLDPTGGWTWQDETLSRVLLVLDSLQTMYHNTHLAKGKQPAKSSPQFQPDYIKVAKDEVAAAEAEADKLSEDDLAAQAAFWRFRNPEAQ